MADLTDSIEIAAPPEVVYAVLSDLEQIGRLSPECTGITWRGSLRAPVEGAKFIGHNRRGWVRWSTFCEVVSAVPDRSLAFEVTVGPAKVSRWEYTIDPTDQGCTVTERWTDRRSALVRTVLDRLMGSRERTNIRGMRHTLEALRTSAVSAAARA